MNTNSDPQTPSPSAPGWPRPRLHPTTAGRNIEAAATTLGSLYAHEGKNEVHCHSVSEFGYRDRA